MFSVILKIEEIYVPIERRKELDLKRVESVAEKIMEEAEEQPILVRPGKDRHVLIKGVHRLEARKALGEGDHSGNHRKRASTLMRCGSNLLKVLQLYIKPEFSS